MKPLKLLAMLLFTLVFTRHDTLACAERVSKSENQQTKTAFLARSAFKALKAVTPAREELHPDFMIGNSLLRF